MKIKTPAFNHPTLLTQPIRSIPYFTRKLIPFYSVADPKKAGIGNLP